MGQKMRVVRIGALVLAVAAGGALAWAFTARKRVEHARYETQREDGDFEVRIYAPRVVAETRVSGPERDALRTGFRRLAGYIFGDNRARTEVAMTAPVGARRSERVEMTAPVTSRGERVEMTAPVAQREADGGAWTITFTMPSDRGLDDLPRPNDERVTLRRVGPTRYAAVRFSGDADRARTDREEERLRSWMREQGLEAAGEPEIARYDPPWTPRFMRRNEVLVPLA